MAFRPVSSRLSSRRSTKTAENGLLVVVRVRRSTSLLPTSAPSVFLFLADSQARWTCSEPDWAHVNLLLVPRTRDVTKHTCPAFAFALALLPPSPQTAAVDPQRLITAPLKDYPTPR